MNYYEHQGRPGVLFGVGDDGSFQDVTFEGSSVKLGKLHEILKGVPPEVCDKNLALVCAREATLRQLLKGRTHSSLPSVIVDEAGNFQGVVTERELIRGILEKRGYEETPEPYKARRDTVNV